LEGEEKIMEFTKAAIMQMANQELEEETLREAVEKEKERIRADRGRSIWAKIFPFKILIVRR
jgi:hypothetical protein